jgi:hypothetical protein
MPRPPAADVTPPPLAKPAPAGSPERRQPPAPDAVQMAAFTPEAAAARAPEKKGNARIIAIILLVIAAAGIGIGIYMRERGRLPQAVRVRVLSPRPAAVYRWFPGSGTVTDHEARTLAFESSGMLAELLPPGTAFVPGDILGRLRGAQPVEALLSRHRARLAFYQQMRDSMRAANNQPELRQAEIKLADKQRLIDETTASLAKLVVRASEPARWSRRSPRSACRYARARRCAGEGPRAARRVRAGPEEIAASRASCLLPCRGRRPRPARSNRGRRRRRAAAESARPTRRRRRASRLHDRDVGGRARKRPRRAARQPGLVPGSRCARAAALRRRVSRAGGRGQRRRRHRVDLGSRARAAPPSGATSSSPTLTTTRWSVEGLRVGDEVIVDAPADSARARRSSSSLRSQRRNARAPSIRSPMR